MGPFPVGTLVYVDSAAGWEVAQVLAAYDDRVEVLLHGVPQVHPLVHVRCVPGERGSCASKKAHEATVAVCPAETTRRVSVVPFMRGCSHIPSRCQPRHPLEKPS
jgi:hypothetical protein